MSAQTHGSKYPRIPWPYERTPGRPRRLRTTAFGREVPVALDPGLDGTEASIHACPIMLRSNSEKARVTWKSSLPFAGRRRRIEVLLVKVEIDTNGFQVLDCSQEINEGIVPR